MASGSSGSSEVARIFLVTNIPPAYGTERGLKNCFRQYCGQEGPQIDYSKVKSPDNNTEAALVTVEGLSSEGAHDALQQKMLLGGRTLNVSHVCSETATIQFCDVDDHLSQTMQKIATRMGLHFITRRREVRVCGPFDLVQQFRMDLRAEIFITAQCSILTPVISGSSQSVQTPMATPRKAQQILIDAHQDMKSSSELLRADEIPLQQQNTDPEQSPFLKQKTMENDTHMVIDNLSPDVLQLLDKIPEGDIPGVQYNPSLGTVTIQGLNKADVEETASKFEAVYETILAPGPNQFQVDIVQLDKETDLNEVLSLLNELNHQYVRCAFVHSEDTQMIKILSNSTEQIEQAKSQLLDQLKPPNPSKRGDNMTADGGTASKGSVQEFGTKLRSGHTVTIKKGDISKESASVLVAMINDRFQVIGEMAAAINAASKGNVQQKVQEHAQNQRSFVNTGDLVMTRGGGALKYKKVYHVICPDVTDSVRAVDVEGTLNTLVAKVLSEAERQRARSVVMPSFVSSAFADAEMVAKAVTNAIVDYCHRHQSSHKSPVVSNITVVTADESTYSCFARNLMQAKTRDTSAEGKAAEVKVAENGGAAVITHVTQAPQAPSHPTPGGAGENPTSMDAVSSRPVPEPSAVVTAPTATKTPPANNLSVTNYRSLTNSAASSPRPSPKSDHPLYRTPSETPAISKPSDGPAQMDENCPVCGGMFTTPTASKCEHSFCSQCLNRAMQNEVPLCPVCKVRLEGIQPPVCPLCNDKVTEAVTTVCCHQIFCRECLTNHLKQFNQCPNCKYSFGSAMKAQPQSSSSMNHTYLSSALPGYAGCDTIQITYEVANGIDANSQPYLGASRVAYLPDNIEGREILKLLQRAWKEGLIYYISPKSEVVWTDIPHKINTTGGQLNRGYPDPQFFYNVKQSLASKGIVP